MQTIKIKKSRNNKSIKFIYKKSLTFNGFEIASLNCLNFGPR